MSTTCGGRMSASALELREDVEALQGSATLEEWAEAMALVMSRVVCKDRDDRPLLVLGLDLLQDGDYANVKVEVKYKEVGGSAFSGLGLGPKGEEFLSEVVLVAIDDIEAGEEISMRYLKGPHGGKYLERYGFVPKRLQQDFSEAGVELTFSAVDGGDDDEDYHAPVKTSLLENEDMPDGPINFFFSTQDFFAPPQEGKEWEDRCALDQMVQLLRLRHVGGSESYLVDAVYVDSLWYECQYRISKQNETQVCQTIIDECDRWLDRFNSAEDSFQEQMDTSDEWAELDSAMAVVRRGEEELLKRIRTVFAQEQRDTLIDEERPYWIDRQMDSVFPNRSKRKAANISSDARPPLAR
mmetsp:Transcript_33888/g.72007  ORF Transcript_33888/g.72007 Transcript_33888/m.72007 type:complete len:354 (+) Transcript_33888:1-1062(+)